MPVCGVFPVVAALATGYVLIVQVAQKPHLPLCASFVTAPIGLVSSILLTLKWGLAGAVASMLLTRTAGAAMAWYMCATRIPGALHELD